MNRGLDHTAQLVGAGSQRIMASYGHYLVAHLTESVVKRKKTNVFFSGLSKVNPVVVVVLTVVSRKTLVG